VQGMRGGRIIRWTWKILARIIRHNWSSVLVVYDKQRARAGPWSGPPGPQ
jgi:hypothetical protein